MSITVNTPMNNKLFVHKREALEELLSETFDWISCEKCRGTKWIIHNVP